MLLISSCECNLWKILEIQTTRDSSSETSIPHVCGWWTVWNRSTGMGISVRCLFYLGTIRSTGKQERRRNPFLTSTNLFQLHKGVRLYVRTVNVRLTCCCGKVIGLSCQHTYGESVTTRTQTDTVLHKITILHISQSSLVLIYQVILWSWRGAAVIYCFLQDSGLKGGWVLRDSWLQWSTWKLGCIYCHFFNQVRSS